ncbi:MAG: PQQ-binding-like beta-propeller repeat protein [Pirellulales bacterium]|nr:PQQ-binding-like beta-propeller repeat protein [Pirellulales bacterium]
MGRTEQIAVCTLLFLCAGTVFADRFGAAAEPDATAGPIGHWEKLPPPPGRSMGIDQIALESHNTLWIMAGTGVHYWTGDGFRPPAGDALRAGQYLTGLYGGCDRPLFASQHGTEENRGKLYRLSDGRALYETDFYFEVTHEYPDLYVSKSGLLFNSARDGLAVYINGQWKQTGAAVRLRNSLVFDTGKTVHFFCEGKLHSIDADGHATQRELATSIQVETTPGRHVAPGAIWGRNRMLLFDHDAKALRAFNLDSGAEVDVTDVNAQLPYKWLYGLRSTDDGSVWFRAFDEKRSAYVLHRISPDGKVTSPEQAVVLGAGCTIFSKHPYGTLTASDGAIWFALNEQGILRYRNGRVEEFDDRVGYQLGGCRYLLEDSRGRIYAASSYGVYTFIPEHLATEGRTRPRRPSIPTKVAWKHAVEVSGGWRVGGKIVLLGASYRVLPILDAATGRPLSEPKYGPFLSDYAWFGPARRPGEMLLSNAKEILLVETAGGQVRQTTPYKLDYRIAPVPLKDGYLVVKGYRGSHLVRIDQAGNEIWDCQLPGYVMLHPAVFGSFAVVQTRGGSYGGQATSGVDLNTGKRLWSETVNAYGSGAAFGDDATYVIEADTWLSPEATEGWLICRKPTTGERLWHYRRENNTISHWPVVDRKRNRVFAVFNRGEVVCLDALDGRVFWETRLPEGPFETNGGRSYDAYWPVIDCHDDLVLVVDRNMVLHLLEVDKGQYQASLALASASHKHTQKAGRVELITMPSIEGENLIVVTNQGVVAYRIAEFFEQPQLAQVPSD